MTGILVLAAVQAVFAAAPANLDLVRKEINLIERDLLMTREYNLGAANQLKKIRRLLALQRQEIELSRQRVAQLEEGMEAMAAQRRALLESIEQGKAALKTKLRELDRLSRAEPLDASWISALEADNQKTYFLSQATRKDVASVERLKRDVQAALGLELRILEEKNKLDYYVNELQDQMTLLTANQEVQREILKTNRASRLEAMARVRALKESERDLEKMIARFRASPSRPAAAGAPASAIGVTLAALKGRLPPPVEGPVASGFGKSFNPKTNLLTFQKGITIGAIPAAPVRAVASGKVVFSGPLKNYGLVAIVEHPGQFFTLYGHMGSTALAEGSAARQGDLIGHASGQPLYFEIRNKNVAINPLQWLGSGSITLSKK